MPPPPRREAAPKEAKASKEPRVEKTDGRQKPDAEPMSIDKEPPVKVSPPLSLHVLAAALQRNVVQCHFARLALLPGEKHQ